ncbi:MAG: efflux RND transporter permease subunit [Xanthomonadales bacterium]|nr:efflux RND transporter permease subunit [Xanthomonadales bacterium]
MATPDTGGLPGLSIRRPVLVLVLNLLIALAGIAALFGVEVRELPDVDRPIVSVRAVFPGASPETMDAEVTSIIEGAVARVSGVQSIRSSSEENNARIRVEFAPSKDLDDAASDVREAVSRVQRELPDDVEQLAVYKADEDASPIITLSVVSDRYDEDRLTRIVEQDVLPELTSIEGVADVSLFGDRQRQLRVVVDPLRLASFGLSVTDVADVLVSAQFDVPAGSFKSDDQQLLVRADASAVRPGQVEEIIIRGTTRVGDIAQVFYGPEDAESYSRLNGRAVIGLNVVRQAGSNTIEISDRVQVAVKRLDERLDGIRIITSSDDAQFIRGAVSEVLISLLLTIGIVVATLWLFFGSPTATLVPSVAIPLALIGTVAAMWLLGFSLNILTLLALVLATGLVVDDAIVVIENIQRRRSQGLGPRAAAVIGARQVFFAVVATTAVLIAVFVPISFLPGTAGRLFREFGFVLAVAVTISSFVSLSLVPAMTARMPKRTTSAGPLRQAVVRVGERLAGLYRGLLHRALDFSALTFVIAFCLLLLAGGLYKGLPSELLPEEDRGVISIMASGPDGVGLSYMERQVDRVEELLMPLVQSGEVESLYTVVGFYDPNRVLVTGRLAPWDERKRSQQEIIASLEDDLNAIPGSSIRIFSSNSLNLRGAGGGLDVALTGNTYPEIFAATQSFARAIEERLANISQPRISYDPTQPQLSVVIDRRRAADLGISLGTLAATLRAMIDGDELVDLNVDDRAVPIFLESSSGAINDPSDLLNLYVRTDAGRLVPLSSVVSLKEEGVAAELDRHAQRRAIEIDLAVTAGYPLQSAVDDLRGLADEVLPDGINMILLGEAATLEETSREVAITYGIALLVVFLVLCAQFESFTSPLVITLTVPFSIAAAIYALFLTGISINVYSQIGLIMLIGLMAKNGILLVEFADQLRDRGASIREAVEEAANVRLRPIAMTIASTALGGLPLILSSGPGAESREAIGWVIFGGLGLSALFTLFLTPVVYLGLARFSTARAAEGQRLRDEMDEARRIEAAQTRPAG